MTINELLAEPIMGRTKMTYRSGDLKCKYKMLLARLTSEQSRRKDFGNERGNNIKRFFEAMIGDCHE